MEDRTAHKVLQSGFYWPTLFKDARKFVLSCDECQRIGNIGRRQEMPINYTHILVAVNYVVLIITPPLKCLKKFFSRGLRSLDI